MKRISFHEPNRGKDAYLTEQFRWILRYAVYFGFCDLRHTRETD